MESLTRETSLPAEPKVVFSTWMSASGHTRMTGGAASVDGDSFTAWDGYISGRFLRVEEPSRIEMAWRTTQFPDDAPDSRVIVAFEAVGEGCRVVIVHTEIPEGQGLNYYDGWEKFYFAPMREFFGLAVPGMDR